MKNEMIKFVSENFDVIKKQFIKDELAILKDNFGDDRDELNLLIEYLYEQIDIETSEELIDVINERSIGADLDSEDDLNELFDMIKDIIS